MGSASAGTVFLVRHSRLSSARAGSGCFSSAIVIGMRKVAHPQDQFAGWH